MTDPATLPPLAADYQCTVLPGAAFGVVSGANLGDALQAAETLCAGDVYRLAPDARTLQLAVADTGRGTGRVLDAANDRLQVATGSEIGTPGDRLRLAARLTFLAPEGHQVDMLLLELPGGASGGTAALALDPVEPGRGHTLIGIDPTPGPVRLAEITPLALARGTRITLADGHQVPVESLRAGARVLTRDHGPQVLQHVLMRTIRAVGSFAPVVIPQDTLGNAGDLVVSQQQRLFIYQRGSDRLTETAEMLLKAGYLVDDERIFLRPGGFADFYALVFDHHEVIYAECIPVESLEVSAATLAALPEDIAGELPALDHRPHFGTEADRDAAVAARERLLKPRTSDS